MHDINKLQNTIKATRSLTSDERKELLDVMQNYNQILQILEPLRQTNTHNDSLESLKDITKTEQSTPSAIYTNLPIGTLKTYDDKNACYPGVHVMFTPENSNVEIDICAIQMHQDNNNTDNKNLYVYVFGNPKNETDTHRITIDTTQYPIH